MSKRVPAEVFPPGEYISDELEERGWSQVEFAEILGVAASTVSELIAGKRSVTPEIAKALEASLGPPAEYWLNLDAYFRLHTTPEAPQSINLRARLREKAPLRDMMQRRWIQKTNDPATIERELIRFFGIRDIEEKPEIRHAARKSQAAAEKLTPVQLAWAFRCKRLAETQSVATYSEEKLRNTLPLLRGLMREPEEIRHVPRILEECGVRFLVVEHLPGSKVDGICFWLDEMRPVVGMTCRLDRIDNFWFVLRHELEHVLRRDALSVDSEAGKVADTDEQERFANEAAEEFGVPRDKMDSFLLRVGPRVSENRVIGFAELLGVHPGIVVGQVQRRLERWDFLRKHLVGVRDTLVPNALTDGFGRAVAV